MSKRRAVSMIEVLVSLLMTLMIGGALFTIFKDTFDSRDFIVGQGSAETRSRTPIDAMADHIRNAQQYRHDSSAGETVAKYRVIDSGTATSVTYYRSNSATDTVTYALSGTNLVRQEGNGTPATVLSNISSLELQFFKTPTSAGNYNNSSVEPTTDIHAPTTAELPYLKQIIIRANVLVDGYEREMVGLVRLRNSPRKVRL